jgi:hypothetical protein
VAAGKGHVHGVCHSSLCGNNNAARACVFSSETNSWGNLISWGSNLILTAVQASTVGIRSILVGNSLYWFIFGRQVGILKLNFDMQSLAVIEVPPDAFFWIKRIY